MRKDGCCKTDCDVLLGIDHEEVLGHRSGQERSLMLQHLQCSPWTHSGCERKCLGICEKRKGDHMGH